MFDAGIDVDSRAEKVWRVCALFWRGTRRRRMSLHLRRAPHRKRPCGHGRSDTMPRARGVEGRQSGRSGLMQAANTGQTDVVRLLLERKADVHAADKVPIYPPRPFFQIVVRRYGYRQILNG